MSTRPRRRILRLALPILAAALAAAPSALPAAKAGASVLPFTAGPAAPAAGLPTADLATAGLPAAGTPVAGAPAPPATGAFRYDIIIGTGDPAPDAVGIVQALTLATLNNGGALAFGAQLAGPGVTGANDYALYGGIPGTLVPLAREGGPVPGGGLYQSLPGDALGAFRGLPRLGDGGHLAFLAAVDPTGQALYADRLGVFTLDSEVAREGNPLPDNPWAAFRFEPEMSNPPALNSHGFLALAAATSGSAPAGAPGTGAALYAGWPGDLRPLARRGDLAPGSGGRFDVLSAEDHLPFGPPAANDAGQVAFTARTLGQPGGPNDRGLRDALYRWDPAGGLVRLAGQGDATAAGPLGALYDVRHAPALNSAGAVALAAGAGGEEGILLAGGDPPGTWVQLVARTGQPVPAGGGVLTHLRWQPSLNDGGDLAFAGRFSGCATCTDRQEGIWAGAPGRWREVVRTGQATPEGQGVFRRLTGSDYRTYTAHRLNLNRQGWVAFLADVGAPDQVRPDAGVYLHDGTALHKVLRSGDTLAGRTVAEVGLAGGMGSGVRGLNDRGQLALLVGFADGGAALVLVSPATTDAPGPPPAADPPADAAVTIWLQVGNLTALVGDQAVTLDVPPLVVEGRTLVPLRFIGTALGAGIAWEPATQQIRLELDGTVATLWLGRAEAVVNGERVPLAVPPELVGGRTLVPLRAVSEILGAAVTWDDVNRAILLTYQK